MKYVAVFRRTVQTSHDTWNVQTVAKILDGQSTIKELMDWVESFGETAFNVEIVKEAKND